MKCGCGRVRPQGARQQGRGIYARHPPTSIALLGRKGFSASHARAKHAPSSRAAVVASSNAATARATQMAGETAASSSRSASASPRRYAA